MDSRRIDRINKGRQFRRGGYQQPLSVRGNFFGFYQQTLLLRLCFNISLNNQEIIPVFCPRIPPGSITIILFPRFPPSMIPTLCL
jgi:hypothetical protein